MAIQILKGTSATISETFQVDGVAADLDAGVPTVTLLKPDGTAGPASGTVTHGAALSGTYSFVLAAQAELTILTITWVGTIGGQPQTLTSTVEVVGDFLFSVGALRAVQVAGGLPFTAAAFPNSVVLARRAEVTDDFEQRTGWSFVPRFARETHDGRGGGEILLDHPKAHRLISVTINGVTQSLSGFTLNRSGVLRATSNYLPSGWFQWGAANVVCEYVHGWDRPPAAISSAALARTAMLLSPSQAGSTVSSWTTPDGTTYSYDQAGQSFQGGGRRFFGVPAIDAVLSDPAYNAMGMAVA
jgi:hypothetical protein